MVFMDLAMNQEESRIELQTQIPSKWLKIDIGYVMTNIIKTLCRSEK